MDPVRTAVRKRRLIATLAKHGDEHDEKHHGNWARGMSGRQIREETVAQGGATIHHPTGNRPESGFAVALPQAELDIDLDSFTPATINAYRRKWADLLARDDTHLGLWLNPDDGRVYLDVSIVTDDLDTAKKVGTKNNQYAVYNLGSGETIDLNVRERVAARYAG